MAVFDIEQCSQSWWSRWSSAHQTVRQLTRGLELEVMSQSQPIFTACREGKTGAVVSLLQQPGGDPNVVEAGQPLLHLAVQGGHTELVRLLLGHPGLEVNRPDSGGLTALHLACSQGRDKLVRIIGGNTAVHCRALLTSLTLQSAVRPKWM